MLTVHTAGGIAMGHAVGLQPHVSQNRDNETEVRRAGPGIQAECLDLVLQSLRPASKDY